MSLAKSVAKTLLLIALAVAGAAAWYFYQQNHQNGLPEHIVSGNGRIEATEYDIATKYAGRLDQVLAEEGEMVNQGQLLAQMDARALEAQIREAEAGLVEAQENREYAQAMVEVRESELNYAQKERERTQQLSRSGHVSEEKLDQANTQYQTARAAIKAARIQVTQAASGITAAEAALERLRTELAELHLKAPVGGRVLYRLAQPGEVLGAGGKVMSLLDLTDVYMTIFLPTAQAGKVAIGAEARIILDAAPQYVIPATVSFVAPRTQFTPKAVETRSEREKLMFRVKVRIDPALLKAHIDVVKTGVPGDAYVRLDPAQDWPASLHIKLPE
ncbi:MAG: HlyD family efflux transporter periplasmic adaptor subunit [Gammaproteobacteria bacterium]|nr:HlyD family efflux transporter periplasmic adaptor subunit [Gammaproteobacteria bacterium]